MEICTKPKDNINIYEIIKNKLLEVNFQPIIHMSRKNICGLEGLIRGVNPNTGELISPLDLFDIANNEGLTLELDRVCRDKTIEAFSSIYETDKEKLLFINIDASILGKVEGSNYLLHQFEKYNINSRNVVIEINEAKVTDNKILKSFIHHYREKGYLIALDDVGAGFSNLDRIPICRPDIIKIDRYLLQNIHKDYYKQEVFKSLANLSNKIGSVVVAEGIELEEEAVHALMLGAHMIQGFYFSKPQKITSSKDILLANSIEKLNYSFKNLIKKSEKTQKQTNKELNLTVNNALGKISYALPTKFNEKLLNIVKNNTYIDCAYVLNQHGIQVSETLCLYEKDNTKQNMIFYSANMGTDHSMKKYYYHIMNTKLSKYITEPYVSLATGNLCKTFSVVFKNIDKNNYILCIDFKC